MTYQRQLGSAVFAVSLLAAAGSANAAVIDITEGGFYPLLGGNIYTTQTTGSGNYVAGSPAFTDTYNFTYTPPPALTTVTSTAQNILGAFYGIDDLSFSWIFDPLGANVLVYFNPDIGAGITNVLLSLANGIGHYAVVLTGTPRPDGGIYTLALSVTNAVPIPPAIALFGAALALWGGVSVVRRRKTPDGLAA